MIEFKSWSQFSQDRFPYELIVKPEKKHNGTFLDIGCNDPANSNNSYALELLGWRGIMSDVIPDCVRSCAVRQSRFILGDAALVDWKTELATLNTKTVDYLSLDVDDNALTVLSALPLSDYVFRTITAEHDAYRVGNTMRDAMRSHLMSFGYEIVCSNVCFGNGQPLEDWWVMPGFVDEDVARKLRCDGVEWSEIFKRLW